jgi:transcriptional regulator
MLKTAFDSPVNDGEWQDFLKQRSFGQVVAMGVGRERPVITPTHFIYNEARGIEFHVHRSNPLLQAISERALVTMTVLEADSFIPSTWNCEPGEDPLWSAPTSYYAVVHATGDATVMNESQLADLLNRQVQRFQPSEKISPVEVGKSFFGRALAGIVGIRIAIGHVEAKFKFGGNRIARHRLMIAQKLAQRGAAGDRAALSHLLRRIELEPTP